MNSGMLYRDMGSSGLRQFGGWVREEFLRALQGREAWRVFREMGDNSAVVGAVMFAITQSMRKVEWREEPANDTPAGIEAADFARSLRFDMSQPWEDHVVEALSMLQFGFAPCEIVYKRRLGLKGSPYSANDASSAFDDGKIGVRRLPLRGQETVLKWFFDENGQIRGLTQQPWIGALIDIPIEKMLLFRPTQHKNNPEGKSILRTAYRAYYFLKRVEELEAILFERMGGLPVVRVPNALLEAAAAQDAGAIQALEAYKKLAMNVRIDEQMGIVMPSDVYKTADGTPTGHKLYDFELVTPNASALRLDSDKVIHRYNVDIMKSVLADFIDLGHQARGTQNLALSKVDMFYTAIEGWLKAMGSVHNRYLLPRVWALNAMDQDLMPRYTPDLAQRVDLQVLGSFIGSIAGAGMQLFPDRDLENYIRGAAGMPYVSDEEAYDPSKTIGDETEARLARAGTSPADSPTDAVKHVLGLAALRRRRDLREVERPYGIRSSTDVAKFSGTEVDNAAARADRNPTPGRKAAGNYRMGHVRFQGLDFTIETPRGAVRRGTTATGHPWASVMPTHYGYIRQTKGADGEHLDAYIGPEPDAPNAWIVDQLDADTGDFDEHKLFVGYRNMSDVLQTYRAAFGDGKSDARLGAVHRVTVAGLKAWVRGDDTALPLGALVGKRVMVQDLPDPYVVPPYFKPKKHLNGSAKLANGHAA
jgi:hypothetical protein